MLPKQPKSKILDIAVVVILMLAISFCGAFSRAYAQDTGDSYAALSKRAGELAEQGKYGEALPLAKRALDAAEREFGPQHETVAKQLGQLGAIYHYLKQPEDVIRVMDRYYDSGLMPNSTRVLAHILAHRELERKDVAEIAGFDERKSRRVTAALHKHGIITAPTHKAPFRIAFPAALAPRLMPGLYPPLPR